MTQNSTKEFPKCQETIKLNWPWQIKGRSSSPTLGERGRDGEIKCQADNQGSGRTSGSQGGHTGEGAVQLHHHPSTMGLHSSSCEGTALIFIIWTAQPKTYLYLLLNNCLSAKVKIWDKVLSIKTSLWSKWGHLTGNINTNRAEHRWVCGLHSPIYSGVGKSWKD